MVSMGVKSHTHTLTLWHIMKQRTNGRTDVLQQPKCPCQNFLKNDSFLGSPLTVTTTTLPKPGQGNKRILHIQDSTAVFMTQKQQPMLLSSFVSGRALCVCVSMSLLGSIVSSKEKANLVLFFPHLKSVVETDRYIQLTGWLVSCLAIHCSKILVFLPKANHKTSRQQF